MTSKRTNVAVWHEKYHRWQIKVQKDGVRKTFYSMQPGRTGQRECHKKADEWLDDGIVGDEKVGKLYDLWLQEIHDTTSETRYIDCESSGRIWILPAIGRKKISAVTEQDLQNILNSAYKAGRAEKTIKSIRGTIIQFLKFCRKCNATTLFPENLKIPKMAKKEKKIMNINDIKKLFAISDEDEFYINAFKFILVTGLRRGELLALQTKRDWTGKTIHVRESINRLDLVTPGKNDNSNREFILSDTAMDVLLDQMNLLARKNIKSKYIFPNMHGERIGSNVLYNIWRRICARHDIDRVSIHELRHTFISMCKDVPLHLLKLQVGHSPSMDTLGQYGHLVEGEMELTAQKIETAFNGVIK